jgi:sarcosine oxidase, subunit beta
MTDVLIIGGGVIGCATAFHLTRRGAKVTLVERGPIASGMTSRSGGFIQTHWDSPHEIKLIVYAREMFRDWDARVGGDCGWHEKGYLHVTGTVREDAVRRVHQMVLDHGQRSEWIERDDLLKLQPLLRVDDLVGGAYEPTSGWANPVAATRAFADAARRGGADVREGVTVTKILHDGHRVTGVATDGGEIAAGAVVLAAGPWTTALHVGPPLPISLERGQVTYLSRPNGLPDREIGFYDEVTGLYTHPDGDTNLVGIDHPFAVLSSPEDYKRELDDEHLPLIKRALAHRLPRLAEGELVRGVVGLYDFTPAGQPIIDRAGLDNYFVAVGFSGVGFKSAPATGLGLAELVLDGKPTSVDLSHLTLERFRQPASPASPAFPPQLIEKIAAVRALLSPEYQDRVIPHMISLPPDQLAAFAMMLLGSSAEDIAAHLRTVFAQ